MPEKQEPGCFPTRGPQEQRKPPRCASLCPHTRRALLQVFLHAEKKILEAFKQGLEGLWEPSRFTYGMGRRYTTLCLSGLLTIAVGCQIACSRCASPMVISLL